MAPQIKCKEPRSPAKKSKEPRSPAKKSKTCKASDPLTQQLAPILAALASSEITAASCDTLQAALPHCLAGPKEERHGFQIKIIDHTVSALTSLEEAARTSLAEAEATAETLRAQAAVAQADFESEQLVANSKKEQSDAKSQEVESLGKDVDVAKDEMKAEIEKKDAFLASKATLAEEQESWQKVLDDLWEPLKAASFLSQQWRKRDKCCAELVEKAKPLSLEESLVEAVKVTLKMKVEQRSAFAQKALTCVEESFVKHRALLAERVTGAADEEAAREAAVAEAQAKLTVVQGKLAEQDKESMELQNAWADLETKAAEAKKAAANFETEVQDAVEEVTARGAEVGEALANSAAFASLCDPPADQPVAVTEEEANQPAACAMEVETETVAVAA